MLPFRETATIGLLKPQQKKPRNLARRVQLFRNLAQDLSSIMVGKRDVILCPLCLNEFTQHDVKTGLLTEEHIIPASTGGTETTLTCKPCNNVAGHRIDKHLARKIALDAAFRGESPAKMKFRLPKAAGGYGAPADFHRRTDGSIHIHIKPTSDFVQSKMIAAMQLYANGESVSLRFEPGLNLPAFTAAMGKAAYLGLFADRGYKYILLPMLDQVRNAIREDGHDRRRLANVIIPAEITGWTDPKAPDRFTFEAIFPGGVPVCASLVNLGGTSGAAWAIFPSGSDPHAGSWDGLIRAADAFRGKSNLQVEVKQHGAVTIRFDEPQLASGRS
jgi:5-methylcytosine-specific restriction endonuclease McrA